MHFLNFKKFISVIGVFSVTFLFMHQGTLIGQVPFRLMTYNGLNVDGREPTFRSRVPYFQTVIQGVNPDILVMQEIADSTGADSILRVINAGGVQYTRTMFLDGYDTDNMLFYKYSKVAFISQRTIPTALRNFTEYKVSVGGNEFRIYSCHLKASQGSAFDSLRLAEVTILRNYLNNLPAGTEFIIAGDMNFYSSSELGYQKFIADEADNDGRAKDLSSLVGNWNNTYYYRYVHTQSTRMFSIGDGGSTGGLDDRFDFMLTSYNFNNNIEIEYVPNSYTVYGNDGRHFDKSIIDSANVVVSSEVANALYYASDHLPVYADFISNPDPAVDTDIIINEILQGSVYKDAVELLVLKPGGSDLRGWILTDLYSPSATPTSAEGTLTMPSNPFLQNVPRYARIVLIADAGGSSLPYAAEDTIAAGDSMLVLLPTTLGGSLSHNGSSRFSLAANDNVVLLTGPGLTSGTLMDKVSYGGDMSGWTSGFWSNNFTLSSGNIAYFSNDQSLQYNNNNGAIGWSTGISESDHSLGEINPNQIIGILPENDHFRASVKLLQNYPNPFNPSTTITFYMRRHEKVTVKIYNTLGHEIRTVFQGFRQRGFQSVQWDGKDHKGNGVSSGIFLCRVTAGRFSQSIKLMMIK